MALGIVLLIQVLGIILSWVPPQMPCAQKSCILVTVVFFCKLRAYVKTLRTM